MEVRTVVSALDQSPFIRQFQSPSFLCNQAVLTLSKVSERPNKHVTHAPMPSHRRTPSRALAFFIFATILLAAIIQSGCTGVTTAKSNSTTSTANSSTSAVLSASPAAVDFGNV